MANPNDALKKADEALKKMVEEKNRQKMEADKAAIMESVGRELPGLVAPLLHQVAAASRLNTDEVISAIHGITINPPPVNVTTPEAQVTVSHEMPPMPEMPAIDTSGIESAIEKGIANAKFPAPQVTVQPAKLPEFPKFPTIPDFPSEVSIRGVDKKTPFPVMMMDVNGKPLQFPVSGGAGGGRADFFTIKDIQTSAGYSIIDQDTGAMKVSGSFSVTSSNSSTQAIDSSGNPYSAANPLPVTFTGSSSTSVSLVNADGAYYSSDNPLPTTASVTLTLPSGQGDTATATRVVIAGNSDASVVVNSGTLTSVTTVGSITNSVAAALIDSTGVQYSGSNPVPVSNIGLAVDNGDSASAQRVVIAGNSSASVVVNSGTITTVTTVGSVTNSIASSLIDSSGVQYSGTNPFPVVITSGSSATSASNIVDSSGVAYTGSNPLPVTITSGGSSTTASAIVDSSGVAYSGSNPIPATTVDTIFATQNITAQDVGSTTTPSANSQSIITGTPTANSTASFALTSEQAVKVQVTGTWTGTLTTEISLDGGTTWAPTGIHQSGTAYTVGSLTANFIGGLNVSGCTNFRVRSTAAMTGTATVLVVSTQNENSIYIANGLNIQDATVPTQKWTVNASGAGYVETRQVSGEISSTYIQNPVDNGDSATALRVTVAGNSAASVSATQVGTWNIGTVTTVTGVTNSLQASLIDSSGVQYSGSNPVPISWVSGAGVSTAVTIQDSSGVGYSGSNPFPITVVTSATATLNTALTDSSGIQYSGSNPVPITWVSGAGVSTTVNIGDSTGVAYGGSNPFPITVVTSATATVNTALTDSGGVQYSGSNPVPITIANTGTTINQNMVGGGNDSIFTYMARTTNPTAVADGADVRPKADKLGRVLTRPMQVRDLIKTAYVSLTNGTETTLLAATAGAFNDLIYISATNTSTAAIQVDLRATTAGNIVKTLYVPASTGPMGVALPVPWPQDNQGNNWTADMGDFTNTTVTLSALFTQEL